MRPTAAEEKPVAVPEPAQAGRDGHGPDWSDVDWRPVDARYGAALADREGADRWLLEQTLATGPVRRSLYPRMGLTAATRLLDVGTGFGALAVELAHGAGCAVVGLDVDVPRLRAARDLATPPAPPAAPSRPDVRFAGGDCTRIPFRAASFDGATARYVLQYFSEPSAVIAELARVVRPGGFVCIVDVDDALAVSHPPLPHPVPELLGAFAELQRRRGGDRFVGRKLAALLHTGGFTVTDIQLLSQAAFGRSVPGDPSRAFLRERLGGVAGDVVREGLLPEATVRLALAVLDTAEVPERTVLEAQLAVIARRRTG